jgi:hypothetical protein
MFHKHSRCQRGIVFCGNEGGISSMRKKSVGWGKKHREWTTIESNLYCSWRNKRRTCSHKRKNIPCSLSTTAVYIASLPFHTHSLSTHSSLASNVKSVMKHRSVMFFV